MLLERKANPGQVDVLGRTALHRAVDIGSHRLVRKIAALCPAAASAADMVSGAFLQQNVKCLSRGNLHFGLFAQLRRFCV